MSAPPGRNWLEREDSDGLIVVRFRIHRLQVDDTIGHIFDQIYGLVDATARPRLVLDFSPVQYLSSSALGKLVFLNKKVQAAGGRLALCCLAPAIQEVLETTALQQLFHIYANQDEARESFHLFDREDRDDVTVLTVRPRALGEPELRYLFDEISGLVTGEGRLRIILDLGNVESLPDLAPDDLRRLIQDKVVGAGGRLVVCRPSPAVAPLLERALVGVHPGVDEAVQSV